MNTNLAASFPSFSELTHQFGPFLGALSFFIIIIVILQWYWYKQNVDGKNKEIERGVKRVTELETTVQKLINQMRNPPKK